MLAVWTSSQNKNEFLRYCVGGPQDKSQDQRLATRTHGTGQSFFTVGFITTEETQQTSKGERDSRSKDSGTRSVLSGASPSGVTEDEAPNSPAQSVTTRTTASTKEAH